MNPLLSESRVAIARGPGSYDVSAPFSPGVAYPEYPFDASTLSKGGNPVYDLVRRSLQLLRMDTPSDGKAEFNPLKDAVHPGDTVVLKPNFVRDFRERDPDDGECLITHGSVLRAVTDYVYIALRGRGRIVIADAPHNDADFGAIRRIVDVGAIQDFFRATAGFEVEVYDLRPECARKIDGVIVGHDPLPGDPAGYVKVNLGARSAFAPINHLCHLLYGSEYDMSELHGHQHDDVHEYLISKTILDADSVISVPKLKTHKKVGLTVNMKNLVGINGNKNWLPHHREGTPAQGGDQFPEDRFKNRVERATVAGFKRVFPMLGPVRPLIAGPIKAIGKRVFGDTNVDTIRSGNWYGNDTTWRMVLDLNRILHYADATGRVHDAPVRRFLSIVDGIIGGEGNGPLDPTPRSTGVIVAGANPVSVDLTCARIMGFDEKKLPVIMRAFEEHPNPLVFFSPNDVNAASNDPTLAGPVTAMDTRAFRFRPHFGWQGHVELW